MAKNLEISLLLDFYGDVLTEKQRDVMEQYYNDDLSLAEIADNFGITRQGVRDSIKRGEGIILELEEKVGFAKRYRAVQRESASWRALRGTFSLKTPTATRRTSASMIPPAGCSRSSGRSANKHTTKGQRHGL